jgi:hypothetical protein
LTRPALAVLALAACACAPAVRPSPLTDFWPDARHARFLVELKGDYTIDACHQVRQERGHSGSLLLDPPEVPDAYYAALSAYLHEAAAEALRGLGLDIEPSTARPPDVRPLTVDPGGDVWFTLEIAFGCGVSQHDPVGVRSILQVTATSLSLHRPRSFQGDQSVDEEVGNMPDLRAERYELRDAIRRATVAALRRFREHVSRPVVPVDVTFDLTTADVAPREFEDRVAGCLAKGPGEVLRVDAVGQTETTRSYRMYLRQEVSEATTVTNYWSRAALYPEVAYCLLRPAPEVRVRLVVRRTGSRCEVSFARR